MELPLKRQATETGENLKAMTMLHLRIIPYQFEPSSESLDISSEESDEEGENNSDERLLNTD